MRVVFADTVGLLAIWDDRDQWHQQASVVYAELFERQSAPSAGIVDHISFGVMRRLGVHEVFTNDRHFAAAGFQVLI